MVTPSVPDRVDTNSPDGPSLISESIENPSNQAMIDGISVDSIVLWSIQTYSFSSAEV